MLNGQPSGTRHDQALPTGTDSRKSGPVSTIEAAGLTKRYGQVLAVDEVSLRVETAEIYALLGLNGAGKTTLILCCSP